MTTTIRLSISFLLFSDSSVAKRIKHHHSYTLAFFPSQTLQQARPFTGKTPRPWPVSSISSLSKFWCPQIVAPLRSMYSNGSRSSRGKLFKWQQQQFLVDGKVWDMRSCLYWTGIWEPGAIYNNLIFAVVFCVTQRLIDEMPRHKIIHIFLLS